MGSIDKTVLFFSSVVVTAEKNFNESTILQILVTDLCAGCQSTTQYQNTLRSPDRCCCLLSQLVDNAFWHLVLIPHLLGSLGSNWSLGMQMSQILHFQAILQIDLKCFWPHKQMRPLSHFHHTT